ncbi:MAG TPA: CvpA family protein [Verrucomicrobiae bacterium]|jgi:hypothetical protein
MIAAVTPAPSNGGMLFDWFDLVFLALVIFALYRGRHNGMTKELIPSLQWVSLMLICGLVDPILGPIFVTQLKLSKMLGFLLAYIALFLVVTIPFSIIKHKYSKDLATSDYFKGNEYYLGMVAGVVKWLCMIMVFLAVLNAPTYTAEQIKAHQQYAQQVYGGGESGYSGDYFPTLQQIQAIVLQNSATGSFVLNQPYLKKLLINAQPPPPKAKPQPVIQFGSQPGH